MNLQQSINFDELNISIIKPENIQDNEEIFFDTSTTTNIISANPNDLDTAFILDDDISDFDDDDSIYCAECNEHIFSLDYFILNCKHNYHIH